MQTFITSDLHFNHGNIHGPRGYEPVTRGRFASTAAMNAELAANWNAAVGEADVIYIVGDFAMGRRADWRALVQRLHGYKILICGNHDETPDDMLDYGFDEAYDDLFVEFEGARFWLNHFPLPGLMAARAGDTRGYLRPEPSEAYDVSICGHVHSAWLWNAASLNVGTDIWGLKPQRLSRVYDVWQRVHELPRIVYSLKEIGETA